MSQNERFRAATGRLGRVPTMGSPTTTAAMYPCEMLGVEWREEDSEPNADPEGR